MRMRPVDEWRRPGPSGRQRNIDLWIGLAVAALAMSNVVLARSVGVFATGSPPPAAEQFGFVLLVTLPLIWRRRNPDVVAVVVAVAFIAAQARGVQEQQLASGALFTALHTLGAWGRHRGRARWLRVGIIASMFVWLAVSWVTSYDRLSRVDSPGASGDLPPMIAGVVNTVLINVLIFGFAYYFGETAWLSARRQHQLEVRAEELRAAQALVRDRAKLDERVRIARELHDVVAHHVSVMGIQASACRRVFDKDPARAKTALAAVESSARTAVEELRRMLGALRASDGDDGQAPAGLGVDGVGALVDRVREAGLTAHYAVFGDPVPVPESVSQAAYRIVQEAVTNTLKHAGATNIDVRMRYLDTELEIDVADDGRGGVQAGGAEQSVGMGLIGMRERVAVHEGTLEVGGRAGGGFRVRARLPYERRPFALLGSESAP